MMGLVNNEGGNRDRDIGENGARAEVFTGEESRTGEEREREKRVRIHGETRRKQSKRTTGRGSFV